LKKSRSGIFGGGSAALMNPQSSRARAARRFMSAGWGAEEAPFKY